MSALQHVADGPVETATSREKTAAVIHLVTRTYVLPPVLRALLAPLVRRVTGESEVSEGLTAQWELLEVLDRQGILDPQEYRELRARLVRQEFKVPQVTLDR
jgi:hypothetical protein